MKPLPQEIDLSILDFLEQGDRTMIVQEERKRGRKIHLSYVSAVCKGKKRDTKILIRALEIAIQRKSKFPKQAIK